MTPEQEMWHLNILVVQCCFDEYLELTKSSALSAISGGDSTKAIAYLKVAEAVKVGRSVMLDHMNNSFNEQFGENL